MIPSRSRFRKVGIRNPESYKCRCPMEIPALLERHGVDTEGDGFSALERERETGEWAEDGPGD